MTNVESRRALKCRSELVEPPEKLEIHESFLMNIGADEFISAFRAVHNLFFELLSDIAKRPDEIERNSVGRWQLFYLFLYLFASGKTSNEIFTVDVPSFRKANKGTKTVKYCENYLKILSEYGFVFKGLKNYRIPNNAEIFSIEFPDMPIVVNVLYLLAEKCYKYKDFYSVALFFSWNYRLVTQALDEMAFEGHELLADGLKDKTEKEFVFLFHEAMKKNGFVCKKTNGNGDGPILRYFENEKQPIYLFEIAFNNIMTSQKYSLNLKLRIRDAEPCLEYLEQCPETVKDMFRQDFRQPSPECESKQFCNKSLNYVYEGKDRWHCACFGASFQDVPIIADNIPHYISLVKLGKTKARKKQL